MNVVCSYISSILRRHKHNFHDDEQRMWKDHFAMVLNRVTSDKITHPTPVVSAEQKDILNMTILDICVFLDRIILKRNKKLIESLINREQSGFRSGSFCTYFNTFQIRFTCSTLISRRLLIVLTGHIS